MVSLKIFPCRRQSACLVCAMYLTVHVPYTIIRYGFTLCWSCLFALKANNDHQISSLPWPMSSVDMFKSAEMYTKTSLIEIGDVCDEFLLTNFYVVPTDRKNSLELILLWWKAYKMSIAFNILIYINEVCFKWFSLQSPNAAVACPSIRRSLGTTKSACKKPDTDSVFVRVPTRDPSLRSTQSPHPKNPSGSGNKLNFLSVYLRLMSFLWPFFLRWLAIFPIPDCRNWGEVFYY